MSFPPPFIPCFFASSPFFSFSAFLPYHVFLPLSCPLQFPFPWSILFLLSVLHFLPFCFPIFPLACSPVGVFVENTVWCRHGVFFHTVLSSLQQIGVASFYLFIFSVVEWVKMDASDRCKLLEKLDAKRLLDSIDTVLADCDGILFAVVLLCMRKYRDEFTLEVPIGITV